jgi:aldose 1-epimerase
MAYPLPEPKNFISNIDGKTTGLWVLQNEHITCVITNYGARVVSLIVPDDHGNLTDVALGYNTLDKYIHATDAYYGAIVGRYANRISKGKFTLGDTTYQLPQNDGANTLHGGPKGFHRQVWMVTDVDRTSIELAHFSRDGEEGFPGNMTVIVKYTLEGKSLTIDYHATTDKATIINLSNHTYWNLNGESSGTINDHTLQLNASHYTPTNAELIPTGAIDAVKNTPFDFTTPHTIGSALHEKNEQLINAGGYDHNFVLRKTTGEPDLTVTGDRSGITMQVFSDQPGMQFYGGNALSGKDTGKRGASYNKQEAFVIEPQHFPDSPNHLNFPCVMLKAGAVFNTTSKYSFGL